MQIADLFYPLTFGLFIASSLAGILSRLFPHRRSIAAFAAVGLLGAAFDYIENIFAWRALWAYPATASTNQLLGVASVAKTTTFWLGGLTLLLAVVGVGVRATVSRISRQRNSPVT